MQRESIDRVWLIGSTGRLGAALTQVLTNKRNYHVITTDKDDIDIRNPHIVYQFAERNRPDYIIHSAALRDRIKCEEDYEAAYQVHAVGARNLAIAANNVGAHLFFLSSDFVFSGEKNEPYHEFDDPHPKTVYGRSKLAGENFLRDFSERYTIIRSSWLYGKRALNTIIDEARTGKVTTSQELIGSPTSNMALAEKIEDLIGKHEYGTFHLSAEGTCTHQEFVGYLLDKLNIKADFVEPKGDEQFFAMRPKYQVLDNMMLRLTQQQPMQHWQTDLDRYIKLRKIGG